MNPGTWATSCVWNQTIQSMYESWSYLWTDLEMTSPQYDQVCFRCFICLLCFNVHIHTNWRLLVTINVAYNKWILCMRFLLLCVSHTEFIACVSFISVSCFHGSSIHNSILPALNLGQSEYCPLCWWQQMLQVPCPASWRGTPRDRSLASTCGCTWLLARTFICPAHTHLLLFVLIIDTWA